MRSMAVAVGMGTRLKGVTRQRVLRRSSARAAVGEISKTLDCCEDASMLVSGFSSSEQEYLRMSLN